MTPDIPKALHHAEKAKGHIDSVVDLMEDNQADEKVPGIKWLLNKVRAAQRNADVAIQCLGGEGDC